MRLDLRKDDVFHGLGDAALLSWFPDCSFRPATDGQRQIFELFQAGIWSEGQGAGLQKSYLAEIKDNGKDTRLNYIAKTLGIEAIKRPKHNLSDDELNEAKRILDRIGTPNCLIFPHSTRGERTWRLNYWLDTAMMIKDRGLEPIICAIDLPEIELNIPILKGKSIRQMSALALQAGVVACCDSGPLHISATLGTPVVAVLGPTNPKTLHYENLSCLTSGYFCSGCHWKPPFRPQCKSGCASMDRVEPVMVADEVLRMFKKRHPLEN